MLPPPRRKTRRHGFAGAAMAALLGAAVFWHSTAVKAAEDCANVTSTTRDIDQCFYRLYQQADAELNALYRELTAKLADASENALLQEAERAWILYRDKECAFETAGTRQGTIHPIEVSDCLTAKTRAHTLELRNQLHCSDGDPSCMHELKGGD